MDKIAVQDVDYDKLKERLRADGQRLVHEPKDAQVSGIDVKTLPGSVRDDVDVKSDENRKTALQSSLSVDTACTLLLWFYRNGYTKKLYTTNGNLLPSAVISQKRAGAIILRVS